MAVFKKAKQIYDIVDNAGKMVNTMRNPTGALMNYATQKAGNLIKQGIVNTAKKKSTISFTSNVKPEGQASRKPDLQPMGVGTVSPTANIGSVPQQRNPMPKAWSVSSATPYGRPQPQQPAQQLPQSRADMTQQQTPQAPQVPQMPQMGQEQQAQNDYLSRLQQMRDESRRYAEQQRQAQLEGYQQVLPTVSQPYEQQVAGLEGQIGQYQQRAEQARQALPGQQQQIEKQFGEQQTAEQQAYEAELRRAAEARRVTQADIERKFANLGTLGSTGYFGQSGETQRAESEFVRGQQDIMAQKQARMNEISNLKQTALSNAQKAVDDQVMAYQDAINKIQSDIYSTQQQKNKAITDLYNNLEKNLNDIDSNYRSETSTYDKQMFDIEMETIKAQDTGSKDFTNELKLNDKFMSEMKAFNAYDVMSNYDRVAKSDPKTSEGQSAILYAYIKMLDPATGVKEGEFSNIVRAQSLVQKANAELQKISRGGFADEGFIKQLQAQAKVLAQPTLDKANELKNKYSMYGQQYGLNTDLITGGASIDTPTNSDADKLRQQGFTEDEIAEYLGGQ